MFDYVHKKKRLLQVILVVILLPFALFGIDSYQSGNSAGIVATVGDSKIVQQEFDDSMRQQQDKLRQALGENFDASMMNTPEMRQAVIDELIAQRVLMAQAQADGYSASDRQVAQLIQGIDAFQENGVFSKARYTEALSRQNLNPANFEARLRGDLLVQQVRETYLQNGFASRDVAEKIIRLNEQQRSINLFPIAAQQFFAKVAVDDAEVDKYYEKNPTEFRVPEQVKLAYVEFSVDDMLGQVNIDTETLRQYYDGHSSEFGTPEERQAAHILIATRPTDTQAEQDAAQAKAQALLKQIKENPDSFAALAKANSQDPGSAAQGGDLGHFARGMMVKPFEDAVFTLNPGEISGLVKSDFGYHIIKLIAVKPADILPFDEARERIFNQLRQQKAADKFAEMAEKFSNAAYEQSDSLEPAAVLVGGKIRQSDWLTKGVPAGAPWTGRMMDAVFTDDVLKNKRNSDAVEVASNTLVAARMLEYKPAGKRELSEVRGQIRQKLQQQKAFKLAVQQGETLLARLQKGLPVTEVKWSAAQSITRAEHGDLDLALVRQVYRADVAKLPQYVAAETPAGYVLARIESVVDGSGADDEEKRLRYVQQIRQLSGEEMLRAYLEVAKQRAKIKVSLPAADGESQP
ncbi:MAG: SurA N-terminal domain-containing protein [Pseudomonadota bacterium]